MRRGAGDSPTYGARPKSQPRSTSQPRTPSANPELVVNAPAVRKFLAQHQGELSGRTDQVGLELMCTLTDQPPHTLQFAALRYLGFMSCVCAGSCTIGALHLRLRVHLGLHHDWGSW